MKYLKWQNANYFSYLLGKYSWHKIIIMCQLGETYSQPVMRLSSCISSYYRNGDINRPTPSSGPFRVSHYWDLPLRLGIPLFQQVHSHPTYVPKHVILANLKRTAIAANKFTHTSTQIIIQLISLLKYDFITTKGKTVSLT